MDLLTGKWTRILFVTLCFVFSVVGFLIKLPSGFRHHDKELHMLFYFLAAAFLNLLFSNKNLAIHILIFCILYGFGMSIEYAQAYTNELFHVRFHGRYDPEDVYANLKGLIGFSVLWVVVIALLFVIRGNRKTANEEA